MDPMSIIVEALGAKIAADLSEEFVKSSYEKLKSLVLKRLRPDLTNDGLPGRETASLEQAISKSPDMFVSQMATAGVDRDREIIELARQIVTRLQDPAIQRHKQQHEAGIVARNGGRVNIQNVHNNGPVTEQNYIIGHQKDHDDN